MRASRVAGRECAECGAPATRWMDDTAGEIVCLCADWPDCQEIAPVPHGELITGPPMFLPPDDELPGENV